MKKFVLDRHVVLSRPGKGDRGSVFSRAVIGPARTLEGGDRVRKRRISWDPSPSPDLAGYRVYWAESGSVGYDSDFADVGQATSLVLPDDIPSIPRVAGPMEIGITALGLSGNESDMCIVGTFVDFTRPGMPFYLRIETL